MRLVCPNCGAQYEVDDRVVPEGGRDVQCSNCGHAWFQRPASWSEPAPDDISDLSRIVDDPDDAQADDDDEGPAPGAMAQDRRRPLDEGVRDILATEAQRELQAREREGGTVETQPDLGMDYENPEVERRRIARERMAKMRGVEEGETLEPEVPPQPVAPPVPAPDRPRRDVFPDIEEINSTLDQRGDHGEPAPEREAIRETAQKGSPGFRRGFSIMLLIAAIAFGTYVMAPQIVDTFPGLQSAMVAYVDLVNGLLGQINGLMQDAVTRIEGAAETGVQ